MYEIKLQNINNLIAVFRYLDSEGISEGAYNPAQCVCPSLLSCPQIRSLELQGIEK